MDCRVDPLVKPEDRSDNDNFLFLSFPGLTGESILFFERPWIAVSSTAMTGLVMDCRVKQGDDRVGYGRKFRQK